LPRTTKIAGRDVPIEQGDPPIVQFSGGRRGKSEAGLYEFWTVFNRSGHCTARWPVGGDPGDRFRRMEGSKADATCWLIAAAADGIRPATEAELISWLSSKPGDSPFAESCRIGSKTMKIVKTAEGFSFEQDDHEPQGLSGLTSA